MTHFQDIKAEAIPYRNNNPNLSYNSKFHSRQVLVDYILSHTENDCRPYLEISILGHPFLGLLDSGSSVSLVSGLVLEKILKLGLPLKTDRQIEFRVADGVSCTSMGTVTAPIELEGKVKILEMLAVPHLSSNLILGADFWMAMDLVPDLRRKVWHFGGSRLPEVCGIQTDSALDNTQKIQLDELLKEKFSQMGEGLGISAVLEHEIILEPDATPIKQRYYPVSPAKQQLLNDELDRMLKEGIVEPSKSPWSSPVILVPKDGGKRHRFCVDYRALNAVTRKDAYPLPYISTILDRLKGARWLSSLDIKSAYHQVSVKKSSRECTAFTIPGRGLFQFRRMPFGLTNAPATWQRLIDQVIGAELEPYVFVYLDDIIVISPDFDTHIKVLGEVLDRLLSAGLTVSREKCHFCRPSLRYLGYVVDAEGLHVDVAKVEAMLNVPPPRNAKEVRRFIGMSSWYRRFIPNFSTIIAPITKLTQKNITFRWTEPCQQAFNTIKNCLVSAPVLTCPDFAKPFVLQTDASAYGLGAVLTQSYPDGEHVICFLSRTLTKAERNYSTTERECLAVIWAVEKLRHFLEGSHFTVVTDHASLLWLHNLKDPTGKLARWALRLQPYNYTIVHRKGRENVVPDFLSRAVPEVAAGDVVTTVDVGDFANTTDKWYRSMRSKIENQPAKFHQWRVNDGLLYKYVRCEIPELSSEEDYWKLVVPKDKRKDLLHHNHDDPKSGHLGSYKTFWRLRKRFTWPKMRSDVARYVRNCITCAQHKPEQKRPAGLMGTRPAIHRPWQMISLDFMGPFPRSKCGYTFLLVVCDYFSKYVLLCPLRSAKSQHLVRYVKDHVFDHFGVPQFLICDNGQQMRSKEFRHLCEQHGVKISFTANYLPRADPVERYNRVIKTMIASYVKDHRKWDEHLAALACAIRTCKSEVTGFSAYYVNFGREYIGDGREYNSLLSERRDGGGTRQANEAERRAAGYRKMFEKIKERIELAQERSRHQYNLRRRPVQYNIGDVVWKKNQVLSDAARGIKAGLCPLFVGPFTIHRKLGSCSYELKDDAGKILKGTWHVQDLKPAVNDI